MVTITFIASSTPEPLEGTAAGSCSGVCGGKSCVPSNWPIGKGNADKGEFEDSISAGALLYQSIDFSLHTTKCTVQFGSHFTFHCFAVNIVNIRVSFFDCQICCFSLPYYEPIAQVFISPAAVSVFFFFFFFFAFFFCYKFLPHFFMPAIEVFLIRRKWLKWRCWNFIVKRKDKSFFAT